MLCSRIRLFSVNLINVHCMIRSSSSNFPTNFSEVSFQHKFKSDEQEKILSTLNGLNRDQLLCLNVTQSKIKYLENYKKKNGPFKALDELLEVDGLSMKMLEKLCKQIISDSPSKNIKSINNENKKLKQILVPPLPRDDLSSAVGVHLAPMGISWAKIHQLDSRLDCWGYQDFGNLPKKMGPTDSFKLALNILRQLPNGYVYVFEGATNMGLQGQKQSSVITSYSQQLELCSMLLALINTSQEHNIHRNTESATYDEVENCVYFLRPKLPARLFKTLVGNECVSSTATIMHLLGESPTNNFMLPCSPITFDQKLKNDYLTQSPSQKELLGQSLMLTIAFIDLCVKKNPVSIRTILPTKK